MGFGGQTGLTPLKFTLKSVFIDRKIIADSRNLKFRRFSQFLTDFLTFQKELKLWKMRKNWSNFKMSGSAIIFLSIKTLFESIFRGFRAVWPPKLNFPYPPPFFAFFHTVCRQRSSRKQLVRRFPGIRLLRKQSRDTIYRRIRRRRSLASFEWLPYYWMLWLVMQCFFGFSNQFMRSQKKTWFL